KPAPSQSYRPKTSKRYSRNSWRTKHRYDKPTTSAPHTSNTGPYTKSSSPSNVGGSTQQSQSSSKAGILILIILILIGFAYCVSSNKSKKRKLAVASPTAPSRQIGPAARDVKTGNFGT